jgi:hypothetical protein
MFAKWAWIDDRFHDGSDKRELALVTSRRKHLITAHHALRDAGYAVRLARATYTASWTALPGGEGDALVLEGLEYPYEIL